MFDYPSQIICERSTACRRGGKRLACMQRLQPKPSECFAQSHSIWQTRLQSSQVTPLYMFESSLISLQGMFLNQRPRKGSRE